MTNCGSAGGRLSPLTDCPCSGGCASTRTRRLFREVSIQVLTCLATGWLGWAVWDFFLFGLVLAAVVMAVQLAVRGLFRCLL